MRSFVLAVAVCLYAVTAAAQVSKVTPVTPKESAAAENPCTEKTSGMTKPLDVNGALRAMAAAKAPDDAGRAWEEAADEVLALVESMQPLTGQQRNTLRAMEEGKSAQQIFAQRLVLLRMVVK